MKEVVRFQSNDGCLWVNKQEAIKRDSTLEIIALALSKLKPRTKSSFKGYIQQDKVAVQQIRRTAVMLSKQEYSSDMWDKASPDKINPQIAIQYLDSRSPASNLWQRLSLIDDEYREWEQFYFILNPDKATFVEIKE